MEVKNADSSANKSCKAEERIFVGKHQEESFDKTPFLIIQALGGEPKTIEKLRSGELLVEVNNSKQATNLKKCTHFANIPVSVSLKHRTLNTSRGVISEPDLFHVSEDEIVKNLKEQHVIEARKIKNYFRDEQIPPNQATYRYTYYAHNTYF